MTGFLKWVPLFLIAVLLGFFATALLRPGPDADPLVGDPLPALALQPLPGGRAGFDPETVEGPYLLNVWASWCPPCRVEHPFLSDLADDGVPIYGLVYKDDVIDANRFLAELGDPFSGLAHDPEGRAGFELGVTGPPETFVIDADGVVRARWRGAVTDIVWIQSLEPAWRAAVEAADAES